MAIVGAGLAGFRTARALRDGGFDGSVVVVGDEQHHPYDRPPLSKQFLSGKVSGADCRLAGDTDDITWRLGSAASRLSIADKRVELSDGSSISFDDVVLATGRRARPWPERIPARGVHTLRTLDDVTKFREDLTAGARIVIIGSGFIGCEAAATLRLQGLDVTVTSVDPYPMPIMGADVGAFARELHTEHGVKWRLGTGVAEIEGDDAVTGVRLADGEVLEADVVLVAIGSLPNTEWLASTELSRSGGTLHVDETCQAIDVLDRPVPGVWAAGDVAAWQHQHAGHSVCIEHWSNARDMADTVAANILGAERPAKLSSVPAFWSDQFDVKIKSVGYLRAAEELVVVDSQPERRALLVEARKNESVIGAIGLNMNKAVLGYQRQLRSAATA